MKQRKTGGKPTKLMTRRKLGGLCLLLSAGLPAPASFAAEARPVNAAGVVVTATRVEQSSFDLPVSIDAISAAQIQEGQYQVNASDALGRVAGVYAPNQFRFSSDQQVSSRGFGARSAFGVRGIRLYADGIPQSMPDGQGQFGTFGLSSAERMEVMRGPFSALYGNSSGGVIQIFTRDGKGAPRGTASGYLGSFDTWRADTLFEGQSGNLGYLVDASVFQTDGYRAHSAARREHLNAKLTWQASDATRVTAVLNSLDQPYNEDPQGLTKAQVGANPSQAQATSFTQNTGGSKAQTQGGVNLEHRLGTSDTLNAIVWYGERDTLGRLAIPYNPAPVARGSGGISIIDREFYGTDLRWTHRTETSVGPLTFTAGLDYEYMEDARTGYENLFGNLERLRRNEDNIVHNFDQYLQAEWKIGSSWTLSGGLRHSDVDFENKDYYIVGVNPNDSGEVSYSKTTPVIGAVYHATPTLNLYANAGKGFETPTFIELAYRPGGASGLNFGLKPSTSNNFEVGLKTFLGTGTQLNLALFAIDTDDEIVADAAAFGRTTYTNAGKTSREGLELTIDSDWGNNLRTNVALTLLDATFDDTYRTTSGTVVNGGNKLPGTPDTSLFAEVSWRHPGTGFSTAFEVRYNSKVYVDDVNSQYADGYAIVNWRGGFEQKFGDVRLNEFVRIDNFTDREYIGGVLVNDANGRFYMPAPGRNSMLGISVSSSF